MRRCLRAVIFVALGALASPAWPHDIPNQRVDRAIQVVVAPERLRIDYEVSLTELTLVQDLRALLGALPKVETDGLLALYGQVTGPLNAKGILVELDGRPGALKLDDFQVVVEEHPRFTFHFEMRLPREGDVKIHDTNFATSEGTSRLAVRSNGVVVDSSLSLPADVKDVAIRPVWQLSDDEERRTKAVKFHFRTPRAMQEAAANQTGLASPKPIANSGQSAEIFLAARSKATRLPRLSRLLDANRGVPWIALGVLALALGAVHALEPGHGKTLVTAVALGPDVRFYQPAILGVATTIAHTGSVLLIAAALWMTGTSEVVPLHVALTRVAGFAIAAAGFWRLGRELGGFGAHEASHAGSTQKVTNFGLIGLGLAGGLVPCWDAVALVVLAAALGRLAAGVALLLAFSAGMGLVLLAVGALATKARSVTLGRAASTGWQARLGFASAGILATIGLFLFFQ